MSTRSNPASDDDGDLIARIKAGDGSAFSQLVEAHVESVCTLARRLLGRSSDVPDVVQDVFLSVLQHLNRFRGDSSFQTWLTRIVVNQCRSHQRRWLLRRRTYQQWAEHKREMQDSLGGESGVHDEVRTAVDTLPWKYREVIVLRYFEGRTAQEMSELLGISVRAVDVRLNRARGRLKQRLSTYYETESAHEPT